MNFKDRHLLHKNKVEDFKAFLTARGVPHRVGNGVYEILQVYVAPHWHKLYARHHMPEHVTVQGALVPLVRAFIADAKMPFPEAVEASTAAFTTDEAPPWE